MSTDQARSRWREPIAIPIVCMVLALLRRSPAWDPPSLWLDDTWMGLALRRRNYEQLFALQLPSPIGFLAIEKWVASLANDLEWPLQVVPAVCGMLAIPLFYLTMKRLVSDRWALGLACLFAAFHPVAELYSMRVKQYSVDMLVVIGLLGLMVGTLQRPSILRLSQLVIVSLIGALFSFASLFVSLCFVHACVADRLWRAQRARHFQGIDAAYCTAALVFDLGVLALQRNLLMSQSGVALKRFWHAYFLHFDSLHTVLLWIARRLLAFPMYALSPWLLVLLPLVFIGARAIARDATLRPLAWASLALIIGLVLAAALDIYPMGVERTGLFAYPLFWAFAAIGCERLRTSGPRTNKQARWQAALACYVVVVCILRPPVVYSDARDRQAVQETLRIRKAGDGLLMQHTGLLALAYYGQRALHFEHYEDVCHRFVAWPDLPDLLVMPISINGGSVRDQPQLADPLLNAFYARRYARIIYLSTHADDNVDQHIIAEATRNGYRVKRIDESPRAHVFVLELSAATERARRNDSRRKSKKSGLPAQWQAWFRRQRLAERA